MVSRCSHEILPSPRRWPSAGRPTRVQRRSRAFTWAPRSASPRADCATAVFNFKDRNQGYKLIAGVRALSLLAVELNYVDLGTSSVGRRAGQDQGRRRLRAGVPAHPDRRCLWQARLRILEDRRLCAGPFGAPSGSDLAYGAGVQLHFGSLSARLEYEAFDAQAAAKPTFPVAGRYLHVSLNPATPCRELTRESPTLK